jgi:hypothetical protein
MNQKTAKQRSGKQQPTGSSRIRTAPVAKTRIVKTQGPKMTGLPRGGCRIRHREYFADVSGSTAFSSKKFEVNPGLPNTFPWLSKIASRYESYKFEKLHFSFETEAPTSSTGVVILAIDFDPTDAAPLSKTDALSYEGAIRSAPWSNCMYAAAKNDLHKRKSNYVRCGALGSSATLALHDIGNLFVVTKAQAGSSVIGELYVDYDVILETPQTEPSSLSKRIGGSGTISNAAIFGTDPALTGCLVVEAAVSTLTFLQSCQCLIDLNVAGGTVIAPVTSSSTATVGLVASVINGAATFANFTYVVRAQPDETLIFDMSGSASITASVCNVGEYQYSLSA